MQHRSLLSKTTICRGSPSPLAPYIPSSPQRQSPQRPLDSILPAHAVRLARQSLQARYSPAPTGQPSLASAQ